MYYKWQIKRNRMNLLLFWAIFCPFTPLRTQKIKMLKKWKKTPGDIIILHKCTINDNHMMHGSPDIQCNRIFCRFGLFFCPFTQLTTQKIRILKNEKNNQRYHHFTQAHHKWQSYDVWFLRYKAQLTEFVLSFWAIFSPLTSLTTQKINFEKNEEKKLQISSFYTCVPKIMIRWCLAPEIWCRKDRWTDGQRWKKWRIEVDALSKNVCHCFNALKFLSIEEFCSLSSYCDW